MHRTPPFLRWSLEQPCALREDYDDWREPERTERTLRNLRAYTDAALEDRIFEGLCVDKNIDADNPQQACGVRVEEIFAGFGGQREVTDCCATCPANLPFRDGTKVVGGCFDMLTAADLGEDFERRAGLVLTNRSLREPFAAHFAATTRLWHGLWLRSPLTTAQCRLLQTLFGAIQDNVPNPTAVNRFQAALATSLSRQLPLHVTPFPSGRVEGKQWIVDPHCAHCLVQRNSSGRHCPVCGHQAHPVPSRRRSVRGNRPYWPLVRFLGEEEAVRLLRRYENFREQAGRQRH